MVVYVGAVTFLLTFLVNEFTSIVIPTYFSFTHIVAIIAEMQVWYILHPNSFVMKFSHGLLKLDDKST